MADSALNQFLGRMNAADMAAFIPDPPSPPTGPAALYLIFNTDDSLIYQWDGAAWTAVTTGSIGGLPPVLTADPGSPADDTWWLVRSGSSPNQSVALKYRIGGSTEVLIEITR